MRRFNQSRLFLYYLLTILFLTFTISSRATDYSYSVINLTSETLGTVTIQLEDSSTRSTEVGTYQTVTLTFIAPVLSVTINGQNIPVGVTTVLTLPSGATAEIAVKPDIVTVRTL